MELHDALIQIAEIRRQVARTEVFRGYRAATVAFSGLLALVGAAVQAIWIPEPLRTPADFLLLWVSAATLSVLATGVEMAWRCGHSTSPLARSMSWLAVEQFLPCVLAGGLLTIVLTRWARESLWMLPGLWSIVFSLGIFASARLLPRPIYWAGHYYLLAGLLCLILAQGEYALSPWAMAVPFGGGQLLSALIIYWTRERSDEQESQQP